MADRLELARQGAYVAGDLDRRLYPYAGVVRRLVRAVLEALDTDEHGCRGCGGELVQPPTGRRREWCSERCRKRHGRKASA